MVTIPEQEWIQQQDGVIAHYGTKRHSGRYPWGSGEDPSSVLAEIDKLKAAGFKEAEAARGLGYTTTQVRDMRTIARAERKQEEIHMAKKLKEKNLSNTAIAQRMREAGFKISGESQVRNLLRGSQERKANVLDNVTKTLRDAVDAKGYVDVGTGVEYLPQLDVSRTRFRAALQRLKNQGYQVHETQIDQLGTGKKTNMLVLAKPGTTKSDVWKNRDQIQQLTDYSVDGGLTSLNMMPPLSLSSKRVGVRYKEQGGAQEDGVMFVRRGVSDVSLGGKNYAQVRIMVDGSHYLKGMAIYKDDLPAGVDVLFNTNKSDSGNKLDAMKPVKRIKDTGEVDMDNPFGASIKRQVGDFDPHTGKMTKVKSVMNIVNEEGDWDKWSKSLSSQLLSKQSYSLAKEQLDLAFVKKRNELDAILKLNNPAVKARLLDAAADSIDSAAVHLKAAALPKQKTQVLLPLKDIEPGHVYAPNFPDGTRLALVRFPHGGPFEIPEVTVNNRNPAGKKLLGPKAEDAIGVHPSVAERLSGADFDGDTVLAIPNNLGRIKSARALKALENFDPKTQYAHYDGMKVMTKYETGLEMGKISNLITDMTIRKANEDEIARAVKHSMVVIDAEKHKLDYKRSEIDNGIAALKKKYQSLPGSSGQGASTLISRASSQLDVPERKLRSPTKGGPIDTKTGALVYEYTGRQIKYTTKKGVEKTKDVTTETTKLAEAKDAHSLSSGTVIEKVYADHSNRLKAMAREARLALLKVKPNPYSPSAKQAFSAEVESLNSKLRRAIENAPRERQAQVFANSTVRRKIQEHPELTLRDNASELKRVKRQALAAARLRTDAYKAQITISEREWDAIQAGAITHSKLDAILQRADLDKVKELATPREKVKLSTSNLAKAQSLHNRGLTWAEVAEALGVSVNTIKAELGGEDAD